MKRWLPPQVSTYGGEIDDLFYLIYVITGVAFILVAVTLLAFLWIYRDRNDGRRATYTHGNNTLEMIWTVIPAAVFVLLAVMSAKSWANIKINRPPADVVVKLEAKQFNWAFKYAGPDGKFGAAKGDPAGKDDKVDENLLRVPVGKVVHLEMTAKDVIHSFFVPQLRLKQDIVPGRELVAWFEATKAGKYEIPCAELCGFGHTTMQGWLEVLEPEQYEAWRAKKWPQTAAAAVPAPVPADSPAGPDGGTPTGSPNPAPTN